MTSKSDHRPIILFNPGSSGLHGIDSVRLPIMVDRRLGPIATSVRLRAVGRPRPRSEQAKREGSLGTHALAARSTQLESVRLIFAIYIAHFA